MNKSKKEYTYKFEKWTSDFLLITDINISCENIFNHIESMMCIGKNKNDVLNSEIRTVSDSVVSDIINRSSLSMEDFNNLVKYYSPKYGKIIVDHTCLLKGYTLDVFKEYLLNSGATRFIINFGGDIYVHNYPTSITVSDHLSINISNGCCFTSNNQKRPNHINKESKVNYDSVTVFSNSSDSSPIIGDLLATKLFSNNLWSDINRGNFSVIYTDSDGYPMSIGNRYYMASPWFNESEIKIKQSMMRPFINSLNSGSIFDPQDTDHSRAYDVSPGTELAKIISIDNIHNIRSSNMLVFPKNTDDLGTIFDMSYGLSLNKVIIRYDDINDKYTIIDNVLATKNMPELDSNKINLININNRSDAVVLGYYFGKGNTNLAYDTTLPDNIMLSVNFPRIKLIDWKYHIIKVDQKDIR